MSGRAIGRSFSPTYDPMALHVLAYAHGFSHWHYRHQGTIHDVVRPGFFDSAGQLLRTGDRIAINCFCGEELVAAGDYCLLVAPTRSITLRPLSRPVSALSAVSDVFHEPRPERLATALSAALVPACT